MPWIEIHISTTEEHVPVLSDELTSFGAVAVTLHDGGDQPILEPTKETPLVWKQTKMVGLFTDDIVISPILGYFQKQKSLDLIQELSIKEIADQNWVRASLDLFKPMCFGTRLWVSPSWETPPEPDAINVILDPGMAFGTGTHATTALCLEWLDQNAGSEKCVIDYGTGSGILGISALKLGAKQVLAVDNDPEALVTARENALQNALTSPGFMTYLPHELPEELEADLIIANILTQPLVQLAPLFSTLSRSGGKIVLSGILAQDAEMIRHIYSESYTMEKPVFKEGWALLVGHGTKVRKPY